MNSSVYTRTASGRTKRRKRRGGPTFVQLFHWMLDLPVWHSLSPRAVVAYLELARRYNGSNNGWLHLSVRELARAWHWSRASAARAIEELVERGFVEITRASGFNVKDRKRQAAECRLTVFFCDRTRQPASKSYAGQGQGEGPRGRLAPPAGARLRLCHRAIAGGGGRAPGRIRAPRAGRAGLHARAAGQRRRGGTAGPPRPQRAHPP